MNTELADGWFFRRNGERCGPVSTMQLKELFDSGQLRPGQAVWKQAIQCSLYFHIEAVVRDAKVLTMRSTDHLSCR